MTNLINTKLLLVIIALLGILVGIATRKDAEEQKQKAIHDQFEATKRYYEKTEGYTVVDTKSFQRPSPK